MPGPTVVRSAADFPPDVLVDRGESVVAFVPALDEAATIAGVLRPLLAARDAGWIDDVVVADSGSSDATAALAREGGATVVATGRPGAPAGKGTSLQRAVSATDASVLVFVDGDLVDVDETYVLGLAGPLLQDRGLRLVKGTFTRRFRARPGAPADGGRVTELLARPLLRVFYPPLAELGQPLSGQIGIRRATFERLHVWPGYGLEMGTLLQVYKRWGIEAIGQVDLGELGNRRQDVGALATMASEVLEPLLAELTAEGRLTADAIPRTPPAVAAVDHLVDLGGRA